MVINLSVSPDSKLASDDLPLELSSLRDTSVTASCDPESFSIIELNNLTAADSLATVHGVVHSFISKVRPENFLIITLEGELRVFNHTEDTVINRDGRRVSFSEVRLGNLVRPTTRYRVGSGKEASGPGKEQDLVVLSLKAPVSVPVIGTIRGISDAPDRGTLITVSNNSLDLVSLLVTEETQLIMQSQPLGITDLTIGQLVVAGSYNPLSSRADRLVLETPRSHLIKGKITAIDEGQSSITVTPRQGNPIDLFVVELIPGRMILRGNSDARFSDLQVGQEERIGFYDPDSLEVLRLVVN